MTHVERSLSSSTFLEPQSKSISFNIISGHIQHLYGQNITSQDGKWHKSTSDIREIYYFEVKPSEIYHLIFKEGPQKPEVKKEDFTATDKN